MTPQEEVAGQASEDPHAIYMAWNTALAERFFNPEMPGRRVVLFVSDDAIQEVGDAAGLDPETFVPAVVAGVEWADGVGVCNRAFDAYEDWRDRNLDFPPYIAALCLFVLAVGIEAPEYLSSAYYPRLRRLLGEDEDAGRPSGFPKMNELWDDLEVWSNQDQRGELGLFEVLFAGEQIYVSVPKGQAVLTEHERLALGEIFEAEQLDRTSNPPDAQLLRAIVRYGPGRLRPRTIALARGEDDDELQVALAEAVAEELHEWDGTVQAGAAGNQRLTGGVRLQLQLDETKGSVQTGLRCVLPAGSAFPDDGYVLNGELIGDPVIASEQVPSWSGVLTSESTGQRIDASSLDWTSGFQLQADTGATFRFQGAEVRVFTQGLPLGLSGYVEAGSLPESGDCIIAATSRTEARLVEWGNVACERFRRIAVSDGLPPGWALYKAEGLKPDRPTPPFDRLLRNVGLRIRLEGGLRTGRGQEYFAFSLPTVVLPDVPDLHIECEGASLVAAGGGRYAISETQPGASVELTVLRGDNRRRAVIHVADTFAWTFEAESSGLNRFGEPATDPPLIAGGMVEGSPDAGTDDYVPGPETLLGDLKAFRNLTFLGRTPGEISHWPEEPVPGQWRPVWAVEMRRRGTLIYVGTDPLAERPLDETSGTPRTAEWREFLRVNRRKIERPADARIAPLWSEFLDASAT